MRRDETLYDAVCDDAARDYLDIARELRRDAKPEPAEYEDVER